jgi:predicted RNA-binding Zn-ribbon protein involved in translation (DUF1610 family)
MSVVGAVVCLIALLVLLAVLLVMVLLLRTERLIGTAVVRLAVVPCPRCGAVIGAEAATAAAAAKEAEVRKLHEDARNKMLRLRVDPHWRFPCPACGAALRFDPGGTELVSADGDTI